MEKRNLTQLEIDNILNAINFGDDNSEVMMNKLTQQKLKNLEIK
jgi:hypothetical protein